MIKTVIVPDTLTVFHYPDFIGDPVATWTAEPPKTPEFAFKDRVSRYNPKTGRFDSIILSDGTTIQPVYVRHIKQ